MKYLLIFIFLTLELLAVSETPWSTGIELHGSIFNNDPDRAILGDSIGFGLSLGYRATQKWTIQLRIENNRWFTSEFSRTIEPGSFNAGVGIARHFFNRRLRSSIMAGTSTLLFDTFFHGAGHTGLYFEARPIGFRFSISDNVWFYHDPWIISIVAPVLFSSPALIFKQFRTTLGVQYEF